MTGSTETGRDAWIARVLGVHVNRGGPSRPLMPIWMSARENLDQQVERMRAALRSYGDEDYDAIASFGFNGLTGQRNTALMVALMEYDKALDQAHAARVSRAVDGYSELLGTGSVLDDYDANPLGVRVSFRATLSGGLAAIRDALDANGGTRR